MVPPRLRPRCPPCVGALPLPPAAVSSLSFSAVRLSPSSRPAPRPRPCACSVFAHSRPCPFPPFHPSAWVVSGSLQEAPQSLSQAGGRDTRPAGGAGVAASSVGGNGDPCEQLAVVPADQLSH